VRGRSVSNDLLRMIDFSAYERNSDWAFPKVAIAMEAEASGVILIGSPVRVPCHRLQEGRDDEQQQNVCSGEERLNMETASHLVSGADSVTSAKRMVSGSSSVVPGTVYRMASQQR
jgi:hypothetical protein